MATARAMENDNQGFQQKAAAWPGRFKSYVGELQAEMRRVTWPNWKQVRATTLVVVLSVFAFALYFWVVDEAFNALITKIFNALTR